MAKFKPTMPMHLKPGTGTAGQGSSSGGAASTAPMPMAPVNPAPYAGTAGANTLDDDATPVNSSTAPSPSPGVGALPKGGPTHPGQPDLIPNTSADQT